MTHIKIENEVFLQWIEKLYNYRFVARLARQRQGESFGLLFSLQSAVELFWVIRWRYVTLSKETNVIVVFLY